MPNRWTPRCMLIQKPTWPVELFLTNMFLWRTHTLKFTGGFPNHFSKLWHGWNVKCPPLVHALMSYNQINQSENNMCYVYIYIYNYKQILDIAVGTNAINPLVHIIDDIYIYIYATIQIKFDDLFYVFWFTTYHDRVSRPHRTVVRPLHHWKGNRWFGAGPHSQTRRQLHRCLGCDLMVI